MKKTITGFLALTVLAFFVVVTVNAQTKEQKDKKATTEVSKDCSNCPSAATCKMVASEAPVAIPAANQAGMKCDPAQCKEGKCDPATCKEACKDASSGMKCDPAKCSHQAVAKK